MIESDTFEIELISDSEKKKKIEKGDMRNLRSMVFICCTICNFVGIV